MKNILTVAALLLMVLPTVAYSQTSRAVTFHNAQTGSSTGYALSADMFSNISVQIEGTWTGTLTFKSKAAGSTSYVDTQCRNRSTGAVSTSATSNGYYDCPGPASQFIVDAVVSTGSVSVFGLGSVGGAGSISGSSSGGATVAEDAAHVSGESIVPTGCRRIDTAASSAGTSGDWSTLDCDSSGRLRTVPTLITPNGDSLVDDTNDALRITSTTVQAVSGNAAHDAADSQSPVVAGGHATASVARETLVTDQDAVRWHFGRDGIPTVRIGCPLEDIVSAVVTATSGANTSGIAAQGAGIKTKEARKCTESLHGR